MSENVSIPAEAVEAAAEAMAPVVKKLEALILARAALEAAAPHLFAPALALADEMDNVHGTIRGHVTTRQLRKALGVEA